MVVFFFFLSKLVLKYFLAYLGSSVKTTNILVWKDSPKKLVWVSLESLFHVVRVTNDSGYINFGFHFYYFCLTDEYLVDVLSIILNYFNVLCPAFWVIIIIIITIIISLLCSEASWGVKVSCLSLSLKVTRILTNHEVFFAD